MAAPDARDTPTPDGPIPETRLLDVATSPDLCIGRPDEAGRIVVTDRRTRKYFRLDRPAAFLLSQLDGRHDFAAIAEAYRREFNEPLLESDLHEFLRSAAGRGLIRNKSASADSPSTSPARPDPPQATASKPVPSAANAASGNPLTWRRSLWDPDRFFTWLEPKITFFWTTPFMVVSALGILAAIVTFILKHHEYLQTFRNGFGTHSIVLMVATLFVVTLLHECAHGLTCKHYGGQVREIGLLLLYFMPAFFCNVSDAWLFPKRRERMAVTLAGGYFEATLWALAVFVWCVTRPDTLVYHVAWIVVTVCGVRTLINFTPLVKLDGYYLLVDALEIDNLRSRALGYAAAHLRWLLWGAPRPARHPRAGVLWSYAAVGWTASVFLTGFMIYRIGQFLDRHVGAVGWIGAAGLGLVAARTLFQGLLGRDAQDMLARRRVRSFVWSALLVATALILTFVKIEKRVGGIFTILPVGRVEVRAPIAGFLESVNVDEGSSVAPGQAIARLRIPELDNALAQKRADLREERAKLALLQTGPRPEEIADAEARLNRAVSWRELAERNLTQNRIAFGGDLVRCDQAIAASQAELERAQAAFDRGSELLKKAVISQQQFEELQKTREVAVARLQEARTARDVRATLGVLQAEDDLARRRKEEAEAQSALTLLKAGTRPEQLEAARAAVARCEEELRLLEDRARRQAVVVTAAGMVTTPHLKEKTGQYFEEGALICEFQDARTLELEIGVAEQDVARVEPGRPVELKVRALPYDIFESRISVIAPRATTTPNENLVTVRTRLENVPSDLRPGMTGYARIHCGQEPIGKIGLDYLLRFIRTEYWW